MRLEEVIDNLVSNAIKFGLGKPIDITVTGRDSRVELAVKDQGKGMSPELRERLFEPYERGASLRQKGGLGLGLYIVKTIVDALHGSVRVETEVDVGSTFTVELPKSREANGRGQNPRA
jgi:signal transduction histidine kinase